MIHSLALRIIIAIVGLLIVNGFMLLAEYGAEELNNPCYYGGIVGTFISLFAILLLI